MRWVGMRDFCSPPYALSYPKENSVTLPLAIIIAEIWFFDSEFIERILSSAKKVNWMIWLILGIAGVAIGIYAFGIVYSFLMEGYAKRHFTLIERILTEGRIVVWYMSLLLWPAPGRLSMEHDVELSTSLLNPLTTLPSLLAIAILLGGSFCLRKKYPVATFGIIWYFLNLAIESTILPLELVFEHRLYLPSFGIFLSLTAIAATGLRYGLKKLSEADYAKVFCSILILFICSSGMLTFVRNEDWEDIATIHHDCAVKAPQHPRANGNYANALIQIGEYQEAIKYAEKTLALGKRGLECYGLATNAIVVSLNDTDKLDEAVTRGEELLSNQPKVVDGDSHPSLCLNLAQAYMKLGREQEAYQKIVQAYRYIEMTDKSSIQKKQMVCEAFRVLLNRCQSKEIDLNGDGVPDPGGTPNGLWIARELEKIGDLAYARQFLAQEYAKDPDNIEIAKVLQEWEKEDALNLAQARNWNFSKKYVHQPFSRFNICMGIAFFIQERQMPEAFMKVGQKCMNWALELGPDSSDALLLAGWYAFKQDKAEEAIAFVREALKRDPGNAKIWVALGVFCPR